MFPFILCFVLSIIGVNCANNPIVSTRYGLIKGLTGSYDYTDFHHNYQAFLGVPFAEPPLGDKRFALPLKFNSTWTTPYEATRFRDGCVQNPTSELNFNISEDCLYLNIWRPEMEESDLNNDELLPVLYFLHGSGYIKKSGSMPNNQGDVLAATQKIIVVNSNYRLGAFGFAHGGHDEMPGNVGLYDTLAVLQWIQDNIKSFGGDPNRVTLAGQSAGGKMTTIISSLPKQFKVNKLYSRLIMMSGSATNQIQVESSSIAILKTKLLARKANCLGESEELSSETINCLKKISADDLLKAQNHKDIKAIGASETSVFLPVYGTDLIPDPSMVNHVNHLKDNKNVPMLFGAEEDEASMFVPVESVSTIQDAYDYTKERVSYALKNITKCQFEAIFKIYFAQADPTNSHDIRSRCMDLVSDMNYFCPSLILSEFLSQVNENIFFFTNVHSAEKLNRPYGTQHGDDVMLAFGAPYRQYDLFTPSDRQFSSIMANLFGDFVKGIPLNDWPAIKLDKNDPTSLQIMKQLSLKPKNIVNHSQRTCMEWAKLFDYQVL